MALALSKESLNQNAEKIGGWYDRIQSLQITRKLGMMAMIAIAVAAGLAVFFWSQKPDYAPLYTGLDDKGTAEATDLLRNAEIPFKINQSTGAISVPQDKLYDARLKLAGAGLTDNGRLGFEMMEKDPGFGVSQFVENARYQYALETELARTIGTLRPVREARVHLAIPKPSAFTRQRDVASASVVLELRGGTTLERNQVDAIVNMVASSIPDLKPERVTVVDQNGRMLTISDPNSEAALSAQQFEQVQRQQSSLNQRIRDLLEPMTGPGRVNPEVSVDMDFSVTEEARELYNGEPPKLRSEQISDSSTTVQGPQGVPGATSNTPPGQQAVPQPAAGAAAAGATAQATRNGTADPVPTETSKSATRNYELDRTLQHTRQPAGRIKRISVAVLLDNVPRPDAKGKITDQPLSAAELTRIEALVKQAVGFNADRGDTVSVMNAPFVRDKLTPEEAPKWWEDPRIQNWIRMGVGALVVLALLFGVVRPTLRQLTGAAPAKKLKKGEKDLAERQEPQSADLRMMEDEDLLQGLEEDSARIAGGDKAKSEAAIALPSDAYEDRLRQAREAVKADSKRVAQVVKGWVASET